MIRRNLLLFLAILTLTACNYGSRAPIEQAPQGAIFTQAAATLLAQLTEIASRTTPTAITTPLDVDAPTSETPTTESAGIPNLPPTSTPLPTATISLPQTPTFPSVLPTSSIGVCLQAKFIEDVTIPDGTKMNPGKEFIKTWRIQNTGTCTWTEDFSIVFVDGDQMGAPASVDLDDSVAPGEKADLSVDFVAPFIPGEFRSEWMLADASGQEFGLGASRKSPFWVEIIVREVDSGVALSFVQSYCSADWVSSAGDLPCPGKIDSETGFVVLLENPEQENRREDEPALWTNPEMEDDGWIKGIFPAIKIRDGDHFLADIGCLGGYDKCNVMFELKYQIDGGKEKSLGTWKEEYDGELTRIDVDLSDLSGKEVQFILKVTANGDYREDAAFWLLPHILRD